MEHEQKFKDLLSSTCLSESIRSMLDLRTRGYERPGFYSHWGHILSLDFFLFSCSKDKNAIIAIIGIFV